MAYAVHRLDVARGTSVEVAERNTKKEAEEEANRQRSITDDSNIRFSVIKKLTSQTKKHWSQRNFY